MKIILLILINMRNIGYYFEKKLIGLVLKLQFKFSFLSFKKEARKIYLPKDHPWDSALGPKYLKNSRS